MDDNILLASYGRDIREPIEVYQASIGISEPLEKLLLSNVALGSWERTALAYLIAGKLVKPKRSKGQRTLPHLKFRTPEYWRQLKLRNAVTLYNRLMELAAQSGSKYRCSRAIIEQVCEQDDLDADTFTTYLLRSRKNESEENDIDPLIARYHQWLLENGYLPEYPQPVSELQHHITSMSGSTAEDQ